MLAQAANMIETSNFLESDIDLTIKLGDRTVLEYVLSPVRKAFHEAAHER